MSNISIPYSFVEVVSPSLADGWYLANALDAVTGLQIEQQLLFVENNTASLKIDSEPNKQVKLLIDDNQLPPLYAEVAFAVTIGDLEFFANETFRVYPGFFDPAIVKTFNGGTSRWTTHELENGSCITLTDSERIIISTHGAYDYLDPGEFATMRVPYTIDDPSTGDDVWFEGNTNVDDSGHFNEPTPGTYEPTGGNREFRWYAPATLEEGETYELEVTTNQTQGSVDVNWLYAGDVVGSTFSQFQLTIIGSYTRDSYPCPANVIGLRFRTTSNFDGSIVVISLRKKILAPNHYLEFTVKASEEVGHKLIAPEALNGANWVSSDGEYTPTTGYTNPLEANIFGLEQNKIYEIALTVTGRTAGYVVPAIVGQTNNVGQYQLTTNDRDVWYIQAPQLPTAVHIQRSPDFDGNVSKVFIRELYCDDVDEARGFDISNPASGVLRLRPLVAPKAGRRSDIDTPEYYYSEGANHSDEFGVRINGESSYVVENVTFAGKRSAVSTKGGAWGEVWNVNITGGWVGPDGIPLTNDDEYQTGVQTSDNSPWMEKAYLYNVDCDLGLAPMQDNYVTQNSDNFLFNSNHSAGARTASAYLLNCLGKNASDGCIDNKLITFVNQSEFEGGHRTIRGHGISQLLVASSILTEQDDSECALHCVNIGERINVWNSVVNGYRVLSAQQMMDDVKPSGRKYAGKGALFGDIQTVETRRACAVLKTFPRMPGEVRLRISHWEWEISLSGTDNWSPLIASNGLFEPGQLTREVNVSPGTYDLRFRAHHGQHSAPWQTTTGVTVS